MLITKAKRQRPKTKMASAFDLRCLALAADIRLKRARRRKRLNAEPVLSKATRRAFTLHASRQPTPLDNCHVISVTESLY